MSTDLRTYKTDYLGIKLLDSDMVKKVKQFIKRNTVDDVVFFFDTINHNLKVRCCMRNGNSEYYIPFEITTTLHPKFDNVTVKVIPAYEELDWLLSEEYILDCNSHNLDHLSIDNNDCEYWMDTLFVRKKNKLIRHDEICFDSCRMFY